MKTHRFAGLISEGPEHVAAQLVPGRYIMHGGLSFHPVGWRTHPEGNLRRGYHEIFAIVEGEGEMEIDGRRGPIHAGEVLVIEPNEEHHVIGDPDHPVVNLWFNFADEPHEDQRGQ